jgi:hypothetical protein
MDGLNNPENLILPDLQPLPPSDLFILVNADTGGNNSALPLRSRITGRATWKCGIFSLLAQNHCRPAYRHNCKICKKQVVVGEFVFHPEHNHWHLGNFARYEMWTISPEERSTPGFHYRQGQLLPPTTSLGNWSMQKAHRLHGM